MIFSNDVNKPEGPVSLMDGSWMIAEMGLGIISHFSANGKEKRIIAETGRPNGLALDGNGNLWIAESKYPAILKLSPSGDLTTISTGMHELLFLWPNDLCFGPDGALYFTDSGILLNDLVGIEEPEAVYDLEFDGRIVRIDPNTNICEIIDRGLRFPNGIVFGLGGEYLYVNETLTGDVFHYRIIDGRVEGSRQLFGNVMAKPCEKYHKMAGPDGMAFDKEGNLYVCVLQQGDITILPPDGSIIGHLPIFGKFPTNIAFSRSGKPQILVTEGSTNSLLKLDVQLGGMALYYP